MKHRVWVVDVITITSDHVVFFWFIHDVLRVDDNDGWAPLLYYDEIV